MKYKKNLCSDARKVENCLFMIEIRESKIQQISRWQTNATPKHDDEMKIIFFIMQNKNGRF